MSFILLEKYPIQEKLSAQVCPSMNTQSKWLNSRGKRKFDKWGMPRSWRWEETHKAYERGNDYVSLKMQLNINMRTAYLLSQDAINLFRVGTHGVDVVYKKVDKEMKNTA